MTEFPDVRVRKLSTDSYDVWEVVEPCQFRHFTGEIVIIPAGYKTVFASVPRWLWSIIPPHCRAANASIAHDYLYDNKIGERLLADLFFYVRLRKDVKNWQAWVMYRFVRWFAFKWWDK